MLYDKLVEYVESGVYPMHMPGHKRNVGFLPGLPCGIDITEVHGFDDLHAPHGILREMSELAAGVYGSDRAFLLVNGSTVGNLAAIGALVKSGERILMARNCHRSVYNAVALFGLDPVILAPETYGDTGIARDVAASAVESALDNNPDIKLVVITSPTYEGVISDVAAIARAAHGRGVPLHVDSAHGAHLGFSPMFPRGAVAEGADVVVMSLHKTLPALTQCSLLHVSGGLADSDGIARMLSILQTSSPSYVLMSSIDRCLRLLASAAEVGRLFGTYERNLVGFSEVVSKLENLSILWHGGGHREIASSIGVPAGAGLCSDPALLGCGSGSASARIHACDPGKIVILTEKTPLSGTELAAVLRDRYCIELEMSRPKYAVAMTSICDRPDGFARLAAALREIDRD